MHTISAAISLLLLQWAVSCAQALGPVVASCHNLLLTANVQDLISTDRAECLQVLAETFNILY